MWSYRLFRGSKHDIYSKFITHYWCLCWRVAFISAGPYCVWTPKVKIFILKAETCNEHWIPIDQEEWKKMSQKFPFRHVERLCLYSCILLHFQTLKCFPILLPRIFATYLTFHFGARQHPAVWLEPGSVVWWKLNGYLSWKQHTLVIFSYNLCLIHKKKKKYNKTNEPNHEY